MRCALLPLLISKIQVSLDSRQSRRDLQAPPFVKSWLGLSPLSKNTSRAVSLQTGSRLDLLSLLDLLELPRLPFQRVQRSQQTAGGGPLSAARKQICKLIQVPHLSPKEKPRYLI